MIRTATCVSHRELQVDNVRQFEFGDGLCRRQFERRRVGVRETCGKFSFRFEPYMKKAYMLCARRVWN